MMRAKETVFLGLLVCIAAACGKGSGEKNSGQKPAPAPLNVAGYIVNAIDLSNQVETNGTLLAEEEILLKPEVAGRITGIFFKEGDRVTKGQVLVQLNDTDLKAQYRQLEAREKLVRVTLDRTRPLLSDGGVSQQEIDIAETDLEALLAEKALIKAQLDKTTLVAPFSGRAGLRHFSVGAYVSPNDIITSLQQTDDLRIDFAVPERYSSFVTAGDKIRFRVDGRDTLFEASVYAIEPRIEEATRNLLLRARFNNRKESLFPGMFARVTLLLNDIPNALMVPTQSIIPEARGKKLVVARNGKAEFMEVETGIRDASMVQIKNNLQPGDTVIISGIMQLRQGMTLNITLSETKK